MKHGLNDIWSEMEGSRKVWKVQAPHGILTFKTKKMAEAWVNSFVNLKEGVR